MIIEVPEIVIELTDYREWKPIQGNLKDLYTKNFEKLKKSFAEKGGFVPVFVWKHEGELRILDGHQRHRLFVKEQALFKHPGGKEDTLYPCLIVEAENLKDAKERLLVISSQFGTMTQEGMSEFSVDLDEGWIEETTNFDAIFTEEEPEELEPEEEGEFDGLPPVDPVTVLGDLYELVSVERGITHRVQCGDSTDAGVVERTMGGVMINLVLSDPPYGVSYVGKTKEALEIKNDSLDEDGTEQLWKECISALWAFWRDGGSIYATVPAGPLNIVFASTLHDLGVLRQQMVWNKSVMVMGRSDYHYKHEPILYGWKPGAKHYFIDDRTKTTVLDFDKPHRNGEHPTMKPVELWVELCKNSTRKGESVYDPFLGSGTTLIACEQLERTCYGQELDEKYMDVIIKRWVKYMTDNGREYKVLRNGEKLKGDDLEVFQTITENG